MRNVVPQTTVESTAELITPLADLYWELLIKTHAAANIAEGEEDILLWWQHLTIRDHLLEELEELQDGR